MAHIFNAIFNALQKRSNAYANVLCTLPAMPGEKVQAVKVVADGPMDIAWEEPVVFDRCSFKGQAKPDATQPIHFVKKAAVTSLEASLRTHSTLSRSAPTPTLH